MITLKAETIEVAGIAAALKAVRLPHNGETKSEVYTSTKQIKTTAELSVKTHSYCDIHPKDLNLMQILERKGDQHAKVLRGIIAWAEIEAPLYWWTELETYVVGHQRLSSASTMHTEGKGLSGEELQKVKAEIPSGRILKKLDYFSYQTLRRIAFQRHNHRLPEWQQFIEWIHTLPLADELIFHGLENLDNGD